ncbi:MAG: hypothetical protein KKA73_16530 [Chloroflexi bacterium]|nr:hypothetical protein [Chloroflexota bacterium]MBU1749292.1 hypothetical protein [Chloroflexota bacterium]
MINATDIRAILAVAIEAYQDYLTAVVRPEELPLSDDFFQTAAAMYRVAGAVDARDLARDAGQVIAQAVAMMAQAGLGDQIPWDRLPPDVGLTGNGSPASESPGAAPVRYPRTRPS